MTKALVCASCFDIRGLDPDGAWVACRCGKVEARWLNPATGTVRVRGSRVHARIMGLNNRFFVPAIHGPLHEDTCTFWRELHREATRAPGYIFDADKRACWACVVKVGETSDIAWDEEA